MKKDPEQAGTRYTIRGWYGYWFYSNLNPLFRLGRAGKLTQSQLGSLPPSAKVTTTVPLWTACWEEEEKLPLSQRSIVRPLFKTLVSWKVIFAVFIVVVGSGAPFANPLILKAITKDQLGIAPLDIVTRWILIVLTLFIPFVNLCSSSYATGTFDLLSVRIRNLLSSVIYKKLLDLRSTNVDSGKIINLLNNDVRSIEMFFSLVPTVIFVPAQVAVCIWLLFLEVDVSIFAGFAYQVAVMPIALFVMTYVGNFFREKQKLTDSRLKIFNEIMNGIRVVKLYCWEDAFVKMIESVRTKEMNMIKRVGNVFAVGESIIQSTTILLPVIIFYCYLRLGNSLTLDKPFVVLTYIGILGSSSSAIPQLLNFYIQASSCISRVLTLLNRAPMKSYVIRNSPEADQQKCTIILRDVFLAWETEESQADQQTTSTNKDGEVKKAQYAVVSTTDATALDDNPNPVAPAKEGPNRALHTLNDISLSVKRGELLAVVGSVGSGKTSFLLSLMNELELISGSVTVIGSIAYHNQSSWIMNATIKDNILFGEAYDDERFNRILQQACLDTDMKLFPAGVMTEIGEKGINLSGGQKARVSFARSLYRQSDVLLLDDPLSAVDAHVGSKMFSTLKAECALGRTIVLVTHQVQFLSECDQILILDAGNIKALGSYESLVNNSGIDLATILPRKKSDEEDDENDEDEEDEEEFEDETRLSAISVSNLPVDEARMSSESSPRTRKSSVSSLDRPRSSSSSSARVRGRSNSSIKKEQETPQQAAALMTEEEKSDGLVPMSVYLWYTKRFSYSYMTSILVLSLIGCVAQAASTYLLQDWGTDQINTFVKKGRFLTLDENLSYIGGYAWENCIKVGCTYFSLITMVYGNCLFGQVAHRELLRSVVSAPIAWFDTTPLGRIINRFSNDIGQTDIEVGFMASAYLGTVAQLVTSIGVMAYSTNGTILCLVVPLLIIFMYIQNFYRATNLELKRLSSIANSPVNSAITTILSGLSSVRAFGVEHNFSVAYADAVETESVSFLIQAYGRQWLQMRIGMLGACCTFFIFCLTSATNAFVPTGDMAIALIKSFELPMLLGMFVMQASMLEQGLNAVDRIKYYTENVAPEQDLALSPGDDDSSTEAAAAAAATQQKATVLPEGWPQYGAIRGEDCVMGYREGPDIIKGLSFSIQAKEKIGIVGRTGSAKSSLLVTLFRFENLRKGKIFIDDVDIATIPLKILRNALTIIPQEAVMFSASVRENIDPFSQHTDAQLWDVLEKVHMKTAVSNLKGKLEEMVAEGGSNFSQGEKQLICFARALLRKPKILICDEATASIDGETDELLQKMLRETFADCTTLTIAHRLDTVIDSTRIMTMDAGKLAEMDAPAKLLENPEGIFFSLWQQHKKLRG